MSISKANRRSGEEDPIITMLNEKQRISSILDRAKHLSPDDSAERGHIKWGGTGLKMKGGKIGSALRWNFSR